MPALYTYAQGYCIYQHNERTLGFRKERLQEQEDFNCKNQWQGHTHRGNLWGAHRLKRCGTSNCATHIVTPTALSPKLNKPISRGKHRKRRNWLIPKGGIVRGKREKRRGWETSIWRTCHDVSSSKCSSYCDYSCSGPPCSVRTWQPENGTTF